MWEWVNPVKRIIVYPHLTVQCGLVIECLPGDHEARDSSLPGFFLFFFWLNRWSVLRQDPNLQRPCLALVKPIKNMKM